MLRYEILDFYLDCNYCNQQERKFSECPLAISVRRIDIENDDETRERYSVNRLPKLILVDNRGNEIKRWEGITEPEDINEFLYENGYAKRNNTISSGSKLAESKVQELDIKLASSFVAESMCGVDYTPQSSLSTDIAISSLQREYSHYCLKAKSNMVMDRIDKSMAHPVIMMLKVHLISYFANPENKKHSVMKWLYESDVKRYILQQICMLSLRGILKNAKDISHLSSDEIKTAIDPDNVTLFIGFYTYFTILANPHFSYDDFNELFIESWYKYYNEFNERIFMVGLSPRSWNEDFKGVLLDV